MNNRRYILFIVLLLVLALLTLLFYSNRKQRFDWSPSYQEASKEPYGAFVIAELLKKYFSGESFQILNDSINGVLPTNDTAANYVFIGEGLFMDSMDVQTLLKFVEKGNTAFISSRTIPYDLMFYVYYEECNENYWEDYASIEDSSVALNLNASKLQVRKDFSYNFYYRGKLRKYDWNYIDEKYFCEDGSGFDALGRQNDALINFAKVRYGEGTFYLHTTPLAFSNIAMLDSIHLSYANRVFSYLTPGKIYWDEYSKTSESVARRRNNSSRALSKESPLQYILSQPPLAWAWYLLVAMGFLYLLFGTKRRQRVIPVLEANTNTSLAFVSTIGRLYFLKNSHKNLALQKMKLFLNFVRERYRLRGSETEEEFVQKLVAKSEVPRALIDKIWRMHRSISKAYAITEDALIEFHQLMEDFYKKCK